MMMMAKNKWLMVDDPFFFHLSFFLSFNRDRTYPTEWSWLIIISCANHWCIFVFLSFKMKKNSLSRISIWFSFHFFARRYQLIMIMMINWWLWLELNKLINLGVKRHSNIVMMMMVIAIFICILNLQWSFTI